MLPFLLAVNFLNFTYTTNPCASNVPVPVVMKGGSFSYYDRKMGQGFDLSVKTVLEGSLQAGTRQAVVVIACDFPIGGTAAAYLFDERNGGAVELAQVGTADWGGDWGAGPDSIHLRFAKQFLYVDQCKDNDCKLFVLTTYAMKNGKLAKVFVQTHTRSS
jgi:hypothetical protein